MQITKRIINADNQFTLEITDPYFKQVCNNRIFSTTDNLSELVSKSIMAAINAGNVTVVPFVAQTLEEAKEEKILAIDSKTSELIKTGFTFDENNFSMSDAAQRNWCALAAAKANGLLAYPFNISTVDEGYYTIVDGSALAMFLVAYFTYQTDSTKPLTTGRILKAEVEACTTVEEVAAVVDNR